jgi:hypothetical protein
MRDVPLIIAELVKYTYRERTHVLRDNTVC